MLFRTVSHLRCAQTPCLVRRCALTCCSSRTRSRRLPLRGAGCVPDSSNVKHQKARTVKWSKLIGVALLLVSSASFALDDLGVGGWYLPNGMDQTKLGITPMLAKCLGTLEGGSAAGRRECLGAENKRQDARMNAAYKKALERLSPPRQTLLRDSQRSWLRFVGNQCELEAGPPTGGTDWTDELAICDLHWRAYRSKFLESLDE